MADRVYLDWNASAPLRPEARAAMLGAMDEVGNPSSVHAEGRRARAIVERARAQAADLVGCEPGEVVFTSGATEAAHLVLGSREWDVVALDVREHDCIAVAASLSDAFILEFRGFQDGEAATPVFLRGERAADRWRDSHACLTCVQSANGETGEVIALDPERVAMVVRERGPVLRDLTQGVGRAAATSDRALPRDFAEVGRPSFAALSAHKLGGPKGAGALIVSPTAAFESRSGGGGQEQGRRAGTENVVGAAGFGAAAAAAARDLANGEWDRVAEMRGALEATLKDAARDLIIFGEAAPRLPNTSCFAVPGWPGETQVMAMDLAGFAVSAGSACSSGKVEKASRVLLAMGFDETTAASAIRVSMGPTTTEAEVTAFADAWITACRRWRMKAA